MESSLSQNVLAAFQEHLLLASSKCGSLMEQLNLVRKKVEGEKAVDISEKVSNKLEDVNKKCVFQPDDPDPMDCKIEQNCEGCRDKRNPCQVNQAKSFISRI